jgi:hypothetical protein
VTVRTLVGVSAAVLLATVLVRPEGAIWLMLAGLLLGTIGLFVNSCRVWRDDPARHNPEVTR